MSEEWERTVGIECNLSPDQLHQLRHSNSSHLPASDARKILSSHLDRKQDGHILFYNNLQKNPCNDILVDKIDVYGITEKSITPTCTPASWICIDLYMTISFDSEINFWLNNEKMSNGTNCRGVSIYICYICIIVYYIYMGTLISVIGVILLPQN